MASITLTFDNGQSLRIANAICIHQHGYNGDGSTASKIAFYKEWLIKQTKSIVKDFEANEASKAAIVNAQNNVETNLIIS